MSDKSILYTTLVLAVIGGIMYFLAESFYFYWIYWWYDIVLHFIVPMAGGFGIYWGIFRSGLIFRRTFSGTLVPFTIVFSCVMAVVIGWEMFEYINGMTDSTEGYRLDTINDLIFGGIGGALPTLIVLRKKKNG